MQEIHSASGTLPYPGLTAREVEAARLQYGPNVLAKPPRTPWYRQFAAKFRDPIIRILIVAALLSALTGGWLEGAGIALAILLATGIAFLNEYRAGKEFDILNEVDDDIPVKTIRDGAFIQVSRRDLVCGDVIFIETGEEVPADARVLAAVNCHVDQSKFTGEPEPVAKFPLDDTTAHESENDPYPADRLLRGSTVLDGYAYARIEAVGPATEIGRTAMAAAEETGNATPLQLQLERLSRVIAVIGGTLAALLFLILLTQAIYQGTLPHALSAYAAMEPIHILLGFFMIAVTLVVVAVPEGLAMSVTLSLAYSMRRMTADHNLVRKMHACETIGAATVICTDKTGTLTMNRMELREAHLPLLDGASPDAATPAGRLAADALAVNGTANLGDGENGPAVLGNPTEGALLLYLDRLGLDYRRLREEFTIQRQWTFHTERKFMATRGLPAGTATPVLHVKGAPEIVLERCGFLRDRDGIRPLTPEDRQRLLAEFQQTQRTGARTLAFAFREQPEETDDLDRAARELVYLGFVAIADPVRPDVPEAVSQCRRAGIEVKVVTGDTPDTAAEIGRQIGLFAEKPEPDRLISGRDFSRLPEEEARERAGKLRIISRARPDDKLKLVRALRDRGEVVAVTGDGTNDAPALNYADVGIAMGKTGTAIAREAADIILLDDSFRSIVNAVLWGRSLYRNIQRFLLFQLTINVTAVGIALAGPFVGVSMPLTVIQMLWVNLIMDTLAALALATEPPDPAVMNDPPRRAAAFIVTPSMTRHILLTAAGFIVVFIVWLRTCGSAGETPEAARNLTLFFTGFVLMQFWNLFNAKCFGSNRSIFVQLLDNRVFLLIAGGILLGQILIVQFGGTVFRTVPLRFTDYLTLFGSTSIVLWIGELCRLFGRISGKRRNA